MTERDIMIKKLSSYQFAAADLKLYLDTHPNDSETLQKLSEFSEKYMKEKEKFEKLYGPLTSGSDSNKWIWINSPWPWENEEDD
ncbi:MAG: spore coat protein CotJB [Ruminococcus sp.]|jgi:spore coat protein JB|nr:spore coat protein CotJB [Ruminococcus sp.]